MGGLPLAGDSVCEDELLVGCRSEPLHNPCRNLDRSRSIVFGRDHRASPFLSACSRSAAGAGRRATADFSRQSSAGSLLLVESHRKQFDRRQVRIRPPEAFSGLTESIRTAHPSKYIYLKQATGGPTQLSRKKAFRLQAHRPDAFPISPFNPLLGTARFVTASLAAGQTSKTGNRVHFQSGTMFCVSTARPAVRPFGNQWNKRVLIGHLSEFVSGGSIARLISREINIRAGCKGWAGFLLNRIFDSMH